MFDLGEVKKNFLLAFGGQSPNEEKLGILLNRFGYIKLFQVLEYLALDGVEPDKRGKIKPYNIIYTLCARWKVIE